jgi:hypothetical protein
MYYICPYISKVDYPEKEEFDKSNEFKFKKFCLKLKE